MPHLKDPNGLIQDIYELKYLLETQVERLGRTMASMVAIERNAWKSSNALLSRTSSGGVPVPARSVVALKQSVRKPSLPAA